MKVYLVYSRDLVTNESKVIAVFKHEEAAKNFINHKYEVSAINWGYYYKEMTIINDKK